MSDRHQESMQRREVLAGLGAVTASAAPDAALAHGRGSSRYTYYAGVGPGLIGYRLDSTARALAPTGFRTEVPEAVQACWRHPRLPVFYVASSGSRTGLGRHFLSAFHVTAGGELRRMGDDVPLFARPIFITVDPSGTFVLSAYNRPAMITAHRLGSDGMLGQQVEQTAAPQLAAYPHQVRTFPSGKALLVPARGNDATGSSPEDPGALHVLDFARGQFTGRQTIAPRGGLSFRPRHADFHPSGRWAYVDLESQNAVQTYAVLGDRLSPEALYTTSTLRHPGVVAPGQLTSAIQVSADGRTLYVANRGTGTASYGDEIVSEGENTIAVFAINPRTGEPTHRQSIEIDGVHARTFCLSPDGAWLAAGAVRPAKRRVGGRVETVSAGLSLFSIAANGALTFQGKTPVDPGNDSVFWVGIVTH